MPYVKAAEYRRTQIQTLQLRSRVSALEAEVARNRLALADKMRIELERVGPTVVYHFFEKPKEQWIVQTSVGVHTSDEVS